MSFAKKFKEICNEINNVVPKAPNIIEVPRFNVHKRSLPPAEDKLVLIGLTQDEADLAVMSLIAREKRHRNAGSPKIYYFDIIPWNANVNERSVYYNGLKSVTL